MGHTPHPLVPEPLLWSLWGGPQSTLSPGWQQSWANGCCPSPGPTGRVSSLGRACPGRTERPRGPGSGRHLILDGGSPYLWGLGASQASSYRVPKTATIPGLPPARSQQGPPHAEAARRCIPQRSSPHHPGRRAYCGFILPMVQGAGADPQQHIPPALGALGPEADLTPTLPVTRSSSPQGPTPPSGSYGASSTGRGCQEVVPPGLLPPREAQRGGPSPTKGCPRAVQSPPAGVGLPSGRLGQLGAGEPVCCPAGGDDLQNCPAVLSAGHSLGSPSPGAKTTRTSPQDEELQELVCCSPGGLQGPEVTGGFIPCAVTPTVPCSS